MRERARAMETGEGEYSVSIRSIRISRNVVFFALFICSLSFGEKLLAYMAARRSTQIKYKSSWEDDAVFTVHTAEWRIERPKSPIESFRLLSMAQSVCTYFIRLCSGVLVLANCQENSRRFIYLCQFQTMLFLFLPLLSLCLFLWWSSSAASPSSLSSLVQWLCRIDSFLAHFLLCFLLQMPTFSWHHVWAWRSPLACIHSIWLAMRVIDTLVLFFFPVVRRLEVDCKNGFSTLRDWDLHSRQDLDRLAPHISGNVISIPRHSAE